MRVKNASRESADSLLLRPGMMSLHPYRPAQLDKCSRQVFNVLRVAVNAQITGSFSPDPRLRSFHPSGSRLT